MKKCEVRQATHVGFKGKVYPIFGTWGINPEGRMAKPSEGGFGVITEDGQRISMWDAEAYYQAEEFMSMWVIYKHPRDFPDKFVARRHVVYREPSGTGPTRDFFVADTLEEIRKKIPPYLVALERSEDDEPQIVEVWL